MIEEKFISEQNQYDLFYNILLSVKSKNPHVRMENDEKNHKCKLETGSISIKPTNSGNSSELSSYSIIVEREEVHRLFTKNSYKYFLHIEGSARNSYNNTRLNFYSKSVSNRCQEIISEIFNYLFNVEEQRKIEKTNSSIKDIIGDISTTVDVSYKRDNKIEEVLNNN
mgnify:FL=1